jgi:Ca2+-binding EF-hand superfamily protein
MLDKKREIYIKIDNISEIINKLESIKKKEDKLKELFKIYDKLESDEKQIFENWTYYLEDISEKLNHLSL